MAGGLPRLPDAQWSTAAAPATEQFDLWREAVNQAFVPVDVSRNQPGAFVSDVTMNRLGGVELSQIASPAQSVSRTRSQVATGPGDVLFLNLPLSGDSVIEQAGRRVRLAAGDFAVVDGDAPFTLGFGTDFRQVSLKLPREMLQNRLHATADVVGVRVAGDRGVGAVTSAAIRAAAEAAGSLSAPDGSLLAERLTDLVCLALGGLRRTPAAPPRLLLQAAVDEATRRLWDPELTPADVASSVGISVRYLHRLFSTNGLSFSRWVLTRRLDLARHDLLNADLASITISEIAYRRGFADPSYFARAFRVQYGVTPRQVRTRRQPVEPTLLS